MLFDNKYGYSLDVVFNDGKQYKRKNMSKSQAMSEYKRYLRDRLILNIKSAGWSLEGKKHVESFVRNH